MPVITAADILLPKTENLEAWSVIACDQFTSDPDYWASVRGIAGNAPTTLDLILPEAMIAAGDPDTVSRQAAENMRSYCGRDMFRQLKDTFIYVERAMLDGRIRRGVVACIDLEAYDYSPMSSNAVKATEGTVRDRLYKRLDLRRNAVLELPHAIVFMNDPDETVMGYLNSVRDELPVEYDFNLMLSGGHICGRSVSGERARSLERLFLRLEESSADVAEGECPVFLAVGDGNHSIATAKLSWDMFKQNLSPEEREKHPARFCLTEIINVYDRGISIEPIHRVVSGIDEEDFSEYAIGRFLLHGSDDAGALNVSLGTCRNAAGRRIGIGGLSVGELIALTDEIIEDYIASRGGAVDYIHDDESAIRLGSEAGSAYILLPTVSGSDIFTTVRAHRIFPKKSFSIGSAREKRYYLEARKITE